MVIQYNFDAGDIKIGQELASMDLGKCGNGPVGALIAKHTKTVVEGETPPFGLYARNPDRQSEAVEILHKLTDKAEEFKGKMGVEDYAAYLKKLSNDIADGFVTEDPYDCYLGVIPIDEMITALERDIQPDCNHRYKWAHALLKAIKRDYNGHDLKVITYGH